MSLLEAFITEYKKRYVKPVLVFDETLLGRLKKVCHTLLDEKFSASIELRHALDRLHIRVEEPMKVAITGQFSSGKSTFLNALLAKNILPTGVTPVTSKVNYIRYGDTFRIRVHYKDGRDEYHDISTLKEFTDQRESVEEVAYLSVYAPLDLLKDVVFVDTPGLNSQAFHDTQTTQKVLKEVDGIIWLSLIDNAGKMSELQVLEEYLGEYQNKSLCVLNQKDKFTPEQIEETTAYIQETFGEFFSEIIPISAKQALESRSHDKKVQVQEAMNSLMSSLQASLLSSQETLSKEQMGVMVEAYQEKIETIKQGNLHENLALLEESNIMKVLGFIHEEIRPKAAQAKEFAITKEIHHITQALIGQHELFIAIYNELLEHIVHFEAEEKVHLSALKQTFSEQLKIAFMRIETIIETISDAIFHEISPSQRVRYEARKARLLSRKVCYIPFSYEAPKINADTIYKRLFYEDNIIGKLFKQYVKNLNGIQEEVNQSNRLVYQALEKRVLKWQGPYEMIRKNEAIHSDSEFSNIRKFASKAYETILKPFHDEIASSYAKISSEFNHLSSAVSFNYQNATEVCVAFLENKIEKSRALYEENPTKFSLYQPKREEIKERLRSNFHLYELENMMNTNHTFLSKDYDRLMENFLRLTQEKVAFLQKRKERHLRAIATIKALEAEF